MGFYRLQNININPARKRMVDMVEADFVKEVTYTY